MCPDKRVWQAYLEGSIAQTDRASAESHLVRCRMCREHLIAVSDAAREKDFRESAPPLLRDRSIRLASSKAGPPSFIGSLRPYVPLALAAAIVMAVGLSVVVYRNQTGSQRPAEFRQSDRAITEISLTNPPTGATLNSGKVEFRWSDAGSGARYEFNLTDEKGDIIFQDKPAANSLTLDTSTLKLLPQRKYYWSITARLPDGTRRESGVAGFTLK